MNNLFLLFKMSMELPDRRRRAHRPPGIGQGDAADQMAGEAMLDLVPGALVFRLLLTPDQFTQVRITGQLGREVLIRERIELLDTDDRDVVETLFPSGL